MRQFSIPLLRYSGTRIFFKRRAFLLTHPVHSDLKSAENVNNFKHKIKDNFFKMLQNREDNPYKPGVPKKYTDLVNPSDQNIT